jgi:hypothetical protein
MMEPQPDAKTDGSGQNQDEVRSKCLILPIEDVTVKYPLGRNYGEIPKWLIRWEEEALRHLRMTFHIREIQEEASTLRP